MTRRVFIVLFPGVEMLDAGGPIQALHDANTLGGDYEVHYVGTTTEVASAQGLVLAKLEPLPRAGAGDWLFVPGYPVMTSRGPSAAVARWIRRSVEEGAVAHSICTGAFVLGAAGLLDGRSCTTHWRRTHELQQRYPRAHVVGERLFVIDGPIVTSAGIASGIDMTLAMIERDRGPVVASAVAREMVVYMRRDGGQRQESIYLDYQTHLSPGVHRVQQRLVSDPRSRASIVQLARLADMSPRHLTRTFRRVTGMSIHEYRTRLRVEQARTLLRNPQLTVDAVARSCGFEGARELRRVWGRYVGGTPRQPA